MSKHTPEPWVRGERLLDIVSSKGNLVARLAGTVGKCEIEDANLRRIVACVNACAGVSNGELAMTTMSVVLARINEAEQQRDELLAALEEAKSVLSSINTGRQHKVEVEDDEPAFWQRNEWVTWAKGEILPMIEAAIAKAKGGAA